MNAADARRRTADYPPELITHELERAGSIPPVASVLLQGSGFPIAGNVLDAEPDQQAASSRGAPTLIDGTDRRRTQK